MTGPQSTDERDPADPSVTCRECGMWLHDDCEYHPYAACLMYRACADRDTVLANLNAVLECGKQSAGDVRGGT